MGLSASSTCVKYLLFVFNLIFLITGVAVLTVGGVVQSHYNHYDQLLEDRFFSVPALLIATGVLILTISFFGCCGAVKENHCMIITFSVLLVVIFILELAAGIAGYVLEDAATNVIAHKMSDSMITFNNDNVTAELWNNIQTSFNCCGTTNQTDWERVMNSTALPVSCCTFTAQTAGNVSCVVGSPYAHTNGCLDAIGKSITKNAAALGGVGIGIAFVQFLGIILSCCLARSIRKHYESV